MSTTDALRPPRPSDAELERDLEAYRRELTGYCYRMLGSGFEAEDAVQETMVRAWKHLEDFEGRSALRSWLYRIATNVCLDMQRGPQRRARAMDLGPAITVEAATLAKLPESAWVQPIPDVRVLPDGDPAEVATSRDTIRLAFVAALQHLPAKQRAVLILCEVLRWQATEAAELLDTTVASVNSALQRARATLAARAEVEPGPVRAPSLDDERQALLDRYVAAFEAYDISSLVTLLHDDATFSMPPHPMWLSGPVEVHKWMVGPGAGCEGARLVATTANGCAAFGNYRVAGPGVWEPFALQVVETSGDRISSIHNFLFPELFAFFGLPERLVDGVEEEAVEAGEA
jgi:RNA polymerase sigma-70 factor (ECF subfamily)